MMCWPLFPPLSGLENYGEQKRRYGEEESYSRFAIGIHVCLPIPGLVKEHLLANHFSHFLLCFISPFPIQGVGRAEAGMWPGKGQAATWQAATNTRMTWDGPEKERWILKTMRFSAMFGPQIPCMEFWKWTTTVSDAFFDNFKVLQVYPDVLACNEDCSAVLGLCK